MAEDFGFDDLLNMDAEIARPAAVAKEPKQARKESTGGKDKGKGKKGQEKEDATEAARLKQVLIAVTQLSLSVAREAALLKSIMIKVALFSTKDMDLIDLVKAETKRYHDKVGAMTAAKKQEQLPPHLFVWQLLCKFVFAAAKDKEPTLATLISDMNKKNLQEAKDILGKETQAKTIPEHFRASPSAASMFILAGRLKVARVVKSYWTADQGRIELCAVHGSTEAVVIDRIVLFFVAYHAGTVKPSQAPKGKLERTLSAWIAEVKKSGNKETSLIEVDE